jgi:hypothetical protein
MNPSLIATPRYPMSASQQPLCVRVHKWLRVGCRGLPSPAVWVVRGGAMLLAGAKAHKQEELTTVLLVLVGLLVLELLLFWGYVVLVERHSSTTVASSVLGAALVTAIALTVWILGLTIFVRAD